VIRWVVVPNWGVSALAHEKVEGMSLPTTPKRRNGDRRQGERRILTNAIVPPDEDRRKRDRRKSGRRVRVT
jgi:hypothetical protein